MATPEINTKTLVKTYTSYVSSNVYAWDLDAIRSARDAQCKGDFTTSARLAEAVKTDAAIFSALENRIAPHRGLPRQITPGSLKTDEAESVFGTRGDTLPPPVLADMFETMAMLGVSISQVIWTPRDDGSRIDARVKPWPMAAVWWDSYEEVYKTYTNEGIITLRHGDGKWIIATLHDEKPWQWGAVKALALTWADRAFGIRDRSQNSEAHGQAKFIGQLPEGISIDSDEGAAFQTLISNLWGARSGGIIPFGAELDMKESVSQAWQIFRELIKGDDADVARVLLGQDGTVKNEGGNYIKSAQLFGVRNDLVEGDLAAISNALQTGLCVPWAAVNIGPKATAPSIGWSFPDPDEDARKREIAERHEAFNRAVQAYRQSGFEIDQPFVDRLADEYGVNAPTLDDSPPTPMPAGVSEPTVSFE